PSTRRSRRSSITRASLTRRPCRGPCACGCSPQYLNRGFTGEPMLRRHSQCPRRGATLVEAAFVYPVLFLLIVGIIVVGLGVSRYQQVAHLAREGARWASVRGAQFATDTGNAAATSTDISNYVKGKAAGLDTAKLTVTPSWNTDNKLTHTS